MGSFVLHVPSLAVIVFPQGCITKSGSESEVQLEGP
jgi:hypothetical protein